MFASTIMSIFSGVVKPLLDKFIPDAKDRMEAEQLFFNHAQELNLGQLEINKEEAKSSSMFVAGWRPFIGWVCGGSLAYAMVGYSFLCWAFQVVSLHSSYQVPPPPAPDTTIAFELLMGLLGLGGLRTYEKVRGVAAK